MSAKTDRTFSAIGYMLGVILLTLVIIALFWSALTTDNATLATLCWCTGVWQVTVFLLNTARAFIRAQVT